MRKMIQLTSAFVFALAIVSYAEDQTPNSPVLLIGDSMMRLPGMAVERELAKNQPDIKAHTFSGIGTGLARLDAFDWLAKISELCVEHRPKVAVITLGANDRQPMQMPDGQGVSQPDTDEWHTEYAARMARAIDLFLENGCEKIVWLLLPPMRDPVVDQHAKKLNELVTNLAQTRPQMTLFDVGSLVADRRTGGFTMRIIDPHTAAAVAVRERDGIHLSPQGARLLATALVEKYWSAE